MGALRPEPAESTAQKRHMLASHGHARIFSAVNMTCREDESFLSAHTAKRLRSSLFHGGDYQTCMKEANWIVKTRPSVTFNTI